MSVSSDLKDTQVLATSRNQTNNSHVTLLQSTVAQNILLNFQTLMWCIYRLELYKTIV